MSVPPPYYPEMLPVAGELTMAPDPGPLTDITGCLDTTLNLSCQSTGGASSWQGLNYLHTGTNAWNRPVIDIGTIYLTRLQVRARLIPNPAFTGSVTVPNTVCVRLVRLQNGGRPNDYHLEFNQTDLTGTITSTPVSQLAQTQLGIDTEIASHIFELPPVPLSLHPAGLALELERYDLEWDLELPLIASVYGSDFGDQSDLLANQLVLYGCGDNSGTSDPNVPWLLTGTARLFFNKA